MRDKRTFSVIIKKEWEVEKKKRRSLNIKISIYLFFVVHVRHTDEQFCTKCSLVKSIFTKRVFNSSKKKQYFPHIMKLNDRVACLLIIKFKYIKYTLKICTNLGYICFTWLIKRWNKIKQIFFHLTCGQCVKWLPNVGVET